MSSAESLARARAACSASRKCFCADFQRLFGISVQNDLLNVDGKSKEPLDVYRKVRPEQAKDIDKDGLEEWGD